MSIEIGELVIRTEVVERATLAEGGLFGGVRDGSTRIVELDALDEIVRRVIDALHDQWRERP